MLYGPHRVVYSGGQKCLEQLSSDLLGKCHQKLGDCGIWGQFQLKYVPGLEESLYFQGNRLLDDV